MSVIDPSNVQWPACFNYKVGDRGTMALGVALTDEIPEEIIATEDFENDPISGFGSWLIDLTNPNTGLRCLQSNPIGDNQTTDYTFNVPVGATSIRFWYRVSSEGGFDFFQVVTDFFTVVFQDSGAANTWTQQTIDVTGVSFVTFRYTKDSSASSGLDLAAVDDLEWIIPGTPAEELYAPFRLTPDKECVQVSLCNDVVSVSGVGEFDIRPLDCDTDSITICPPASGAFEVTGCVNANVKLTCEEDSITVCPPASGFDVTINPGPCPIPIVAAECIPVNVRLDCEVDSVTVCPGEEPLLVELSGPVSGTFEQRPLECDLDFVTVCPPASGVFNVDVGNEVNIRPLDCVTDSITVCVDDPIDVNARTATLNNGTQITVGVAATLLSAANANRRSILIQNIGGVAARVGTTGVTATTGFKLNPGGHLIFNTEDVPTNAIFAIRDGASDTTVLVQEVVM